MCEYDLQKYTLVSLLGEGSHGKVYYGYNNETKLEVAVKVINVSKSPNTAELSFRREIAFLKKLNNPHVRQLYDVVEDASGLLYIVLEFCDWELLNDSDIGTVMLNLNIKSLRDIFNQILQGVYYIHEQGVVHRDIKPSNILVARTSDRCFHKSKRVVLSDFGVSSLLEEDSDKKLRGSPMFLSPELISIETSQQYLKNPVIDCWATGVTFYILAFGISPWTKTSSRMELFQEIQDYAAGKTQIVFPPVDQSLKDLLLGLLHPDPSLRLTAKQALEHPWFGDERYIPMVDCIRDTSKEDLDTTITLVNQMGFQTKLKPLTKWNLPSISCCDRFLLILDSTIQLIVLCSNIINHAPEDVRSTEFCELENQMKELVETDGIHKSSAQYSGHIQQWVKIVDRDVTYGIEESPSVCKLGRVHLTYLKDHVLPLIRQQLEELSSQISEGSCVSNVATGWRFIDFKKFKSIIQTRIDALRRNPSFESCVEVICNSETVLQARPNIPHHSVIIDFVCPNAWSSASSSEGSTTSIYGSKTYVLAPFVAIDLLCDLISSSIKFSPSGTVVRAAVWNELLEGNAQLRLACQSFSSQHVNPTDLEETGITFGGSLTKCIVVTESLLNGSFSLTSSDEYSLIRIDVPIPAHELNHQWETLQTSVTSVFHQMDHLEFEFTDSSTFDTLGDDSCYSTIITDFDD
ncbi:hypothetical protein P9112_010742 [Eukaryota sp. TZLM1-RC]